VITPLWTRDACVMSCDRRGCQQRIEAATADDARSRASAAGWWIGDHHYCAAHRSTVDMWERW